MVMIMENRYQAKSLDFYNVTLDVSLLVYNLLIPTFSFSTPHYSH